MKFKKRFLRPIWGLLGLCLTVCPMWAGLVSSGDNFSGFIQDGTGVLRTWGDNTGSKLGHSAGEAYVSVPFPINDQSWTDVTLAKDFGLGLKSDGSLWAWGNNSNGQLGIGSVSSTTTPVKVLVPAGVTITQVAAGQTHVVALDSHGYLYTWGGNGQGQLGLNDTTMRMIPTKVGIGIYTKVAASLNASAAIASNGTLWTWGANSSGELAGGGTLSSPINRIIPAQVGTATNWSSVVAGSFHFLALRGTALYGWGSNVNGQLGQGPTGDVYFTSPMQIAAGLSWKAIGAGAMHSLAVTTSGQLYAWGMNLNGQCGVSNPSISDFNVRTPTLIGSNLAPWSDQIDGGSNTSILKTVAGGIYMLGANNYGQLGRGVLDTGLSINSTLQSPDISGINLQVSAPGLESVNLGIGTSSSVKVSLQNIGLVDLTGTYTVSIYLSSDNILDSNDLKVATTGTVTGGLAAAQAAYYNLSAYMPGVSPGDYYLISQITSDQSLDLYSPSTGYALAVSLVAPDFYLSNLTIPNGVIVPGGTLSDISVKIRNGGMGVVPAGTNVKLEAYLSRDDSLDTQNDTYIGERSVDVSGLSGGDFVSSGSWNLAIPNSLPGGAYYLVLVVNRNGTVAETDNLANSLSGTVSVTSYDLKVSAPQIAGQTGSDVGVNTFVGSITTVLQNVGAETYAGNYDLELYLSKDASLDTSDLLIATQSGSSLAGLASVYKSWSNVEIPDWNPGNYYLLARVNTTTAEDPILTNNVAASPVTLVPPSLVIDNVNFTNGTAISPQANGSFGNVTFRLYNDGPGAVDVNRAVDLEVYLSTDQTLQTNQDVLLDSQHFIVNGTEFPQGLQPGNYKDNIQVSGGNLQLPSGTPNGEYYILFVANGNQLLAADSFVLAKRVAMGILDLKVSAPIIPGDQTQFGSGSTLPNLSLSITNLGQFSSREDTMLRLYLSVDDSIDNGDTLLAQIDAIGAIGGGGQARSLSFTDISLDAGTQLTSGDHYLIAKVISPSDVSDANPSNDQASTKITIQRPSLKITAATTPTTLDLDQATPELNGVSFTLENQKMGVVPADTAISYSLYLVSDDTQSLTEDREIYTGSYTSGLDGNTSTTISLPSITIDPNKFVGGTYQLVFAIQPDISSAESFSHSEQIFLLKANAPGVAMEYGRFSLSGNWTSVVDFRASGGKAFQSPLVPQGQSVSMTLYVEGPTSLKAPWLLFGEAADTLSYQVRNSANTLVKSASLTGYYPTYLSDTAQQGFIDIPSGLHSVTWTFTHNGSSTASYARIDLDVPQYITSGDSIWSGEPVSGAVNGSAAQSPVLVGGQQASLSVAVEGPVWVSFRWKSDLSGPNDFLGFYVDEDLVNLPTKTYDEDAQPATLKGTNDWQTVAFLVPTGPRTLRWTYHQVDTLDTGHVYVDDLVVLSPIPATTSANRDTNPADHPNVPPSNVDLAITDVVAPTGQYLLDDANGTSRLPVTITVSNLGADYSSSPLVNLQPEALDSTNLDIRLSTNQIFGDSDDHILGNFAKLETVAHGDQIVFDADINLPFDIPSGDYYLLVRFKGGFDTSFEFTLANNTKVLSSGYEILRRPDLVINGFNGLASNYPYHPEDPIYIKYLIANTGLGTVLPTQPFNVTTQLMAVRLSSTTSNSQQDLSSVNLNSAVLVKAYTPLREAVYLPEYSAQHPSTSSSPVLQYMDIPSLRDTLVALGQVAAGEPEDSAIVYAAASKLYDWAFFYQILVDSSSEVEESSETNLFRVGYLFRIVPLPTDRKINFGEQFGDPSYGAKYVENITTTAENLGVKADPNSDYEAIVNKYAFAHPDGGAPGLLYNYLAANGTAEVLVPSGTYDPYLTISFNFNVLANDVSIHVEASPNLADWSTILPITPPYFGTSGTSSLTGFGGLKDNPYVLAVEGNSTNVQQNYVARITVRDLQPIVTAPSRFMRLKVVPLVEQPSAPINLGGVYNADAGTIDLTWSGTLPTIDRNENGVIDPDETEVGAAYVIERSIQPPQPGDDYSTSYSVVGAVTTSSFSDTVAPTQTYYYRIRAVSVGGASPYTAQFSVTVP